MEVKGRRRGGGLRGLGGGWEGEEEWWRDEADSAEKALTAPMPQVFLFPAGLCLKGRDLKIPFSFFFLVSSAGKWGGGGGAELFKS